MPQLPQPTTEHDMAERLDDLANAITTSEWDDAVMTPGMQALLGRYAMGEITDSEFRAQVGIAIARPRLDLCH